MRDKEKRDASNKAYIERNIEKLKEKQKEWRDKNKEKIKEKNRLYREKNANPTANKKPKQPKEKVIKEKKPIKTEAEIKASKKLYYEKNKERIKCAQKEWQDKNKEKTRLYNKEKYNKNTFHKLKVNVRNLIGNSIRSKNFKKLSRTEQILGCSFDDLKLHLESQFESWMTWENRGLYNGEPNFGWDVDHIIPLNSALTLDDVIRLNHYTNLQPLCSYINRNIKKGF